MSTDYKEKINELKDSLRIEDVIGAYVHLEHKAGGKCLGICPFHDDSHPSMSVHKGKQIFKCFSCDVGGDVFAFIQKREQCSFVDAVKILRERFAGGSVPMIMLTPRKVRSKPKPEPTPAHLEALRRGRAPRAGGAGDEPEPHPGAVRRRRLRGGRPGR